MEETKLKYIVSVNIYGIIFIFSKATTDYWIKPSVIYY